MANDDLLKAYKNTRVLITQTPADKEKIINEYIDLVVKINNLNETPKAITNDTNNELANMFKNPLEISIYNNFQKYNDVKTKKPADSIFTVDNEKKNSITELAKINEYTKK
jgi:hypothetical protein